VVPGPLSVVVVLGLVTLSGRPQGMLELMKAGTAARLAWGLGAFALAATGVELWFLMIGPKGLPLNDPNRAAAIGLPRPLAVHDRRRPDRMEAPLQPRRMAAAGLRRGQGGGGCHDRVRRTGSGGRAGPLPRPPLGTTACTGPTATVPFGPTRAVRRLPRVDLLTGSPRLGLPTSRPSALASALLEAESSKLQHSVDRRRMRLMRIARRGRGDTWSG
jgi:hypothetical protein